MHVVPMAKSDPLRNAVCPSVTKFSWTVIAAVDIFIDSLLYLLTNSKQIQISYQNIDTVYTKPERRKNILIPKIPKFNRTHR